MRPLVQAAVNVSDVSWRRALGLGRSSWTSMSRPERAVRRTLGYLFGEALLLAAAMQFGRTLPILQGGVRIETGAAAVILCFFALGTVPIFGLYALVYDEKAPSHVVSSAAPPGILRLLRSHLYAVYFIVATWYLILALLAAIVLFAFSGMSAAHALPVVAHLLCLSYVPMFAYTFWLYRQSGQAWMVELPESARGRNGVFKARHQYYTPTLLTMSLGLASGMLTGSGYLLNWKSLAMLALMELAYALMLHQFREAGRYGQKWLGRKEAFFVAGLFTVSVFVGLSILERLREGDAAILRHLVAALFLGTLVGELETLRYIANRDWEVEKRRLFRLASRTSYTKHFKGTLHGMTFYSLAAPLAYAVYSPLALSSAAAIAIICVTTWVLWVVFASNEERACQNRSWLVRSRWLLFAAVPGALYFNGLLPECRILVEEPLTNAVMVIATAWLGMPALLLAAPRLRGSLWIADDSPFAPVGSAIVAGGVTCGILLFATQFAASLGLPESVSARLDLFVVYYTALALALFVLVASVILRKVFG